MGARRHEQEGAVAPWKCKVFCALVVTAKRSVFVHYFHNLSSVSGASPPDPPPGAPSLDSAGDFRSHTPYLPTSGKNSAGAHEVKFMISPINVQWRRHTR